MRRPRREGWAGGPSPEVEDWPAADSARGRWAARPTRSPPAGPASGEGLTTWLARTVRWGRPYLASRVRRASAARPRGGAPGRTRAGGGEPGGQRAAEEAAPRPYDRTGRGPTVARAACGHCRASLVRRSHMLLRGCRERAPEASRRYLPPGARTRVTANLTSSHSRLHVRSAHCPLTFNWSNILPDSPSAPANGLTHIWGSERRPCRSRDTEGVVRRRRALRWAGCW